MRLARTFEELASRYGMTKEFRKALGNRISPKSWSGSVVPLLEVYLKPLKEWSKHKIPTLATWAKDQVQQLENRIEREKEYEGR